MAKKSKRRKSRRISLTKLKAIIKKHEGEKGCLIPILQETQAAYGYLSKELLKAISDLTGTTLSQLYGTVTFYSQFRLHPQGKNMIRVCHGTACHVSGAPEITKSLGKELSIENGETTKDKKFSLESVVCLGCCSLAPVMMVNDDTHGRLTNEKAKEVVKKYE